MELVVRGLKTDPSRHVERVNEQPSLGCWLHQQQPDNSDLVTFDVGFSGSELKPLFTTVKRLLYLVGSHDVACVVAAGEELSPNDVRLLTILGAGLEVVK